MTRAKKTGRPPSISLGMLEEAACELFFERGYAQTSVADIAQRAGVSRATFFNYVAGKDDLLWVTVDAAIDQLAEQWATAARHDAAPGGTGHLRAALAAMARTIEPCTVVLALANADLMGLTEALAESSAIRQQRLASILAKVVRQHGATRLRADVVAAAYAGAFLAALRAWSEADPGRTALTHYLNEALSVLDELSSGLAPLASTDIR